MLLYRSMLGMGRSLGVAGILALGVGACSGHDGEDARNEERSLGDVGLGLTLPDASVVNEVTYVLTRNGQEVRTGTIDIGADGRATALLTNLAAGGGYLVTLNAVRTVPAGAPPCSGMSTSFAVMAGATTTVNVVMQCDSTAQDEGNVSINGTFNLCPRITSTSATPTSAEVGARIALVAAAEDRDPSDTVTFQWSAPSGIFSAATSASTSYTCTAPGEHQINLTVTDGPARGCSKMLAAPIVVTCVAAPDAGTQVDSGSPVVDSGTPEVDSGVPDMDSGTPEVDSGTPEVDSGTPEVDSGTPEVDSGTPVVDSGTGGGALAFSAGCLACANSNCNPNPFSGQDLVTDCADSICRDIIECAVESDCAINAENSIDPGSISRCYCGAVTPDVCDQGSYVPNGECQTLFEQGVGTSVKSEVILRLTDATYSGADAFLLLQCVAEFCPAECAELIQ